MTQQTKDELFEALDGAALRQSQLLDKVEGLEKRERDQKTKIGKVKNVARFYRAQRDRVDAYLSAVLDMIDRKQDGRMDETVPVAELRDVVMGAERAMERSSEVSRGRRPRVQEPFVVAGDRDDGRTFGVAAYRDVEPPENWEAF